MRRVLFLSVALLSVSVLHGCAEQVVSAADSGSFQAAIEAELKKLEPQPTLATEQQVADSGRVEKLEKDVAALWNLTNMTLEAVQEVSTEVDAIKSKLEATSSGDASDAAHAKELAKLTADELEKIKAELATVREAAAQITAAKTQKASETKLTGRWETRCVGRQCYQVWVAN